MNREDIVCMAREAGIAYRERIEEFNSPLMDGVNVEDLEHFAALVAVAEREAILLILKGIDRTETEDQDGWWETSTGADFGDGILNAIRARSETT